MAAECSVKSLQDTVTCGLCQEYFTDPVSIHCGHSFCRACIDQRWGEWEINFACPQCGETARKRKIRPNRELESVVRFAKRLKREAARGERVCEEHREPLRLFCKEEQKLLCAACSESKDHGAHELIPMEEAAQDCKAEIQTWLQVLREDREKLLTFKQARETSSQEFLEKVDAEKQKTRSQFEQLHQFLEEQEHFFLAQLQELVQRQDEYVAKLCQEISWLDALTDEMEEKCQQPAIDFLQDVGRTLIRCKKWEFQQPADNSVEQKQRLHRLSKRNIILEETIEKLKAFLPSELEREWANVTLDPDTAHPSLALTQDRKSVKYRNTMPALFDCPQRFDTELFVLGSEGFTSGKHYWEVEVGVEVNKYWTVGIARESVKRKGKLEDNYGGIWALKRSWKVGYQALSFSQKTQVSLSLCPRKIRVSLDYEGQWVTFFDIDKKEKIFTLSSVSFNGERILPFFSVPKPYRSSPGTELRLCS